MKSLLLIIMMAAPATHPQDVKAGKELERALYPIDRQIIMIIKEEVRRIKLLRKRNASLPVCPIDPGTYWNIECV